MWAWSALAPLLICCSEQGREEIHAYVRVHVRDCKKSFEVVLTASERAAGNVHCPTCASGEVTPRMAIFTAKTSRKS